MAQSMPAQLQPTIARLYADACANKLRSLAQVHMQTTGIHGSIDILTCIF